MTFLLIMLAQVILFFLLLLMVKIIDNEITSHDVKMSMISIVPVIGIGWFIIVFIYFVFTFFKLSEVFENFTQKIADWFNRDKK